MTTMLAVAARTGGVLTDGLRNRPRSMVVAVALIFAADLALRRDDLPIAVAATIDEPAHLATACLVLVAVPHRWLPRSAGFIHATLAGSVALDLDHLPEVLGWSRPTADRPATHSVLPLVLLVALTPALPDRWRTAMIGFATGVALHLGRDLATGGAPIGAPLTRKIVQIPYPIYALALIGAAARISGRHTAMGIAAAVRTDHVEYDDS